MWDKSSRNRENEEGDVNADLSLPDKIRMLGGGAERRDDLFRRAANAAGISFSQAKRIFYGETTDPKSSVRRRIDAAIQKASQKAEAHARGKLDETGDVARLVARAVEADADLRRQVVALVLRKLAGDSAEDRTMAEGDD